MNPRMAHATFDKERLLDLAERHREAFQDAQPFRHVVIDDFLPEDMAQAVLDAFPEPERMEDFTRQHYENKIAMRPDNADFPEAIETALNAMMSGKFVTFLEVLTGIDGLVTDPHFSGAGLHQVMDGGKLGVHVDYNFNKHLRCYRRLNVLIYLNRAWKDEYGGHLELWDPKVEHCMHRIAPVFNRMVAFETSDHSWHGHPDPLRLPEGMTRKSIALYYHCADRGEQALEAHWTRHQRRPGSRQDSIKRSAEKFLLNLTPPILHRFVRRYF